MKNSKYISNTLSLRKPQRDSLEIFEKICEVLELKKEVDLVEELEKVKKICPTITSFERYFPSFCFALATGVGKTRLMGALIAYLHYEKGINNFFIMAPGTTIYEKLKKDFSDPSSPKYVFKGLDRFINPPRIIDGDSYSDVIKTHSVHWGLNAEATINIFNIDKLNSDSTASNKKGERGKPPKIKRLNELIGQSYFDYLRGLPDLCIFMDESHRYHADASFTVINELEPILGVELTATPLKTQGSRKVPFENIVYEYSLAQALADEQYVKIPTVLTKANFNPSHYSAEELDRIKLKDGVTHHRQKKIALVEYARNYDKPLVKPFILVVARDTEHAEEINNYISSDEFFKGYYRDKVIVIYGNQTGAKKEENIKRLVSLESEDNKVEIVIHVNMLKEGWDVNNLYTIIPLRASASDILTEQTMGRGLRLPYGERTGVFDVDSLTIVGHDNYDRIIQLANDESSIFRKEFLSIKTIGEESEEPQEVIELTTRLESSFGDSYMNAMCNYFSSEDNERVKEVTNYLVNTTEEVIMNSRHNVKNYDDLHKEETSRKLRLEITEKLNSQFSDLNMDENKKNEFVEQIYTDYVNQLTGVTIAIPQGTVQANAVIKQVIAPFELDVRNINWKPNKGEFIIQELQQGGKRLRKSISNDLKGDESQIDIATEIEKGKCEIVTMILKYENIDYEKCSSIIQDLIIQLDHHLHSYLNREEVLAVLVDKGEELAKEIYRQMNANFYTEQTDYNVNNMRGFSKIEKMDASKYENDDFKHFTDDSFAPSEIKKYIFSGFEKSCHTLYKFDSNTERLFSTVLEYDQDVLKWMCPSVKQFNIYYEKHSNKKYEPDFIVETKDKIYMIETKARKDENDDIVIKKALAGAKFCEKATEFNCQYGKKPWQYGIIFDDEIKINSTFEYLIANMKRY